MSMLLKNMLLELRSNPEINKKEREFVSAKKFSPLNSKLTFINRRSLELGDELIVYSQIHKIIFELMEGLN